MLQQRQTLEANIRESCTSCACAAHAIGHRSTEQPSIGSKEIVKRMQLWSSSISKQSDAISCSLELSLAQKADQGLGASAVLAIIITIPTLPSADLNLTRVLAKRQHLLLSTVTEESRDPTQRDSCWLVHRKWWKACPVSPVMHSRLQGADHKVYERSIP